jgi:hypothetical protein
MQRLLFALCLTGALIGLLSFDQPAVSFGLVDSRGLDPSCPPDLGPGSVTCPGDFIATEFPTAVENDHQTLTALAATFDSLSSSTVSQ